MKRNKDHRGIFINSPAFLVLFAFILLLSCNTKQRNLSNTFQDKELSQNFRELSWEVDLTPVLRRSEGRQYDSRVVGDPCIVWDDSLSTWRMFYFAGGYTPEGNWRVGTGMALSRSANDIGPGDWEKIEPVKIENEEALLNPLGWHKWWIVMEAKNNNAAAKIDGLYWAVFTVTFNSDEGAHKHIQVASAKTLSGPWKVVPKPVLSPEKDGFDGKHCDTPTAYWFPERREVIIFYKAYPEYPQQQQPGSVYGSGTVIATWKPGNENAKKIRAIQRPGQTSAWNQGWMSTPQIFFDSVNDQWYGLINGSPTPPEDESHREPAPSLGGWVLCEAGKWIDADWRPDTLNSPFLYPNDLSKAQMEAGLGVNFWRHHLLKTPGGEKRIFFNSGKYGTEQMYSLVNK